MSTFRLLEKIGEGSYSQVYKAINQLTQQTVAVKIIHFKDAPQSYVQSREIKILRDCTHPNITSLLQSFVSQNSIYLVFEYLPMNLSQYYRYFKSIYNKNLDFNQITHIMLQICSAIAYLHSKNIMHRDLKPQNIMINPQTKQIKIIDFGFAKYKDPSCCTGYMVTRWYRPLEIVLGLPYDQRVDIFALGAIFLELINGQQIFQSESNIDQMHRLLTICGFPQPSSRQGIALQKFNLKSTNTNQLRIYTKCLNDLTRELVASMVSSSTEKRPTIDYVIHVFSSNLLQSECNQQVRRESLVKTRKRAFSVSRGLTIISTSGKNQQKRKIRKNESNKKYELTDLHEDESISGHLRLCNILG